MKLQAKARLQASPIREIDSREAVSALSVAKRKLETMKDVVDDDHGPFVDKQIKAVDKIISDIVKMAKNFG